MELETTLSETAPETSPQGQTGGPTDGLAAKLAIEHDAGPAAQSSPETHSVTGKRIGRPPTHGRYSKAAGSDGKNPVPLPGPEPVPAVEMESPVRSLVNIPPDLLSKIVGETLSLGETYAAYKLEAIADKAGLTCAEIQPQLERTQMGEQRKAIIADLTPLALQEWGLDPRLSPTAAIGLMLGPWLAASVGAYFTLATLAAERLALDKAKNGKT